MLMKRPKINFSDQYQGFEPDKCWLYRFLVDKFSVELSDKPDYIIVGPYGFEHLKYNGCIKILWTGENGVPDFNFFDYAIGFDHLSFGDRYVRVPLYVFRDAFQNFRNPNKMPTRAELLNRGFCSFVVSNGDADPLRTMFYKRLSEYKRIDSGGRYMNNIGGPVKDKMSFVSRYKFSITFENSSAPGYVTEKMMEAQSVWSVPIYWGDPLVESDFRRDGFVRVSSPDDVERAVQEVVYLDCNDDEYIKKCTCNVLADNVPYCYEKELELFFRNIFSQPLDGASRLVEFGFQATNYRRRIIEALNAKAKMNLPLCLLRRLKHTLIK